MKKIIALIILLLCSQYHLSAQEDFKSVTFQTQQGLKIPFVGLEIDSQWFHSNIFGEIILPIGITNEQIKVARFNQQLRVTNVLENNNEVFVLMETDTLVNFHDPKVEELWMNFQNKFDSLFFNPKNPYKLREYRSLNYGQIDIWGSAKEREIPINNYTQKAHLNYYKGVLQQVNVMNWKSKDTIRLIFQFFVSNYQHFDFYSKTWNMDANKVKNPFMNVALEYESLETDSTYWLQFHFNSFDTYLSIAIDKFTNQPKNVTLHYSDSERNKTFIEAISFKFVEGLLINSEFYKQTYFGADDAKLLYLYEYRSTESMFMNGFNYPVNQKIEF